MILISHLPFPLLCPRQNAKSLAGPGTYLPFPHIVASKGTLWENEPNSVQDELIFQYLLIPKVQADPDPLPQTHGGASN